ncbi:hypothetical protein [Mycobacterium sp.]|uniref:hypothetical protein n=1 Tax=Mycobacterium sp. TaxID=1785 RepID=UPI003D0E524C
MTVVNDDPFGDFIAAVTLWRYWHVPTQRGQRRNLRNISAKDVSPWVRGVTHAVCPLNPEHTPPHRDCTCGLYGSVNLADVQHASACRYRALDQSERLIKLGLHGTLGSPQGRGIRMPQLEQQVRNDRRFDLVLGRIRAFNAIPHQRPPGSPKLPSWRAQSAQIEALYISTRVTLDPERLRATLTETYGVLTEIGYPPYTQADWDTRANVSDDNDSAWAEVGLHPPGKTPPPRRFFTASAPGRKRLRTWTEQT